VHHAEAGRILAERWGLPAEFRIIAGRHHDPSEGGELDLLRIVHVACRLADALGFDVTRPLVRAAIETVLSELPGRAKEQLQTAPDEWRTQIERRIRAFDQNERDSATEPVSPELPKSTRAGADRWRVSRNGAGFQFDSRLAQSIHSRRGHGGAGRGFRASALALAGMASLEAM
jgi:hypothetical protein